VAISVLPPSAAADRHDYDHPVLMSDRGQGMLACDVEVTMKFLINLEMTIHTHKQKGHGVTASLLQLPISAVKG